MTPSSGAVGAGEHGRSAPAISACTWAAARAMRLLLSLPSEPSGPGGRPERPGGRGPLGRPLRAALAGSAAAAISWRIERIAVAPVGLGRARPPGRRRPARCGYHL